MYRSNLLLFSVGGKKEKEKRNGKKRKAERKLVRRARLDLAVRFEKRKREGSGRTIEERQIFVEKVAVDRGTASNFSLFQKF